jgi:hypothetical protein
MVPQHRVRVKYGAYGAKVVKEPVNEYNRYTDKHLVNYLKRRKVRMPKP